MYNLNPKETVITITNFISSYIQQSGTKGAVIGLSGGIDSTVSAYLSVKALGKENVFGILIPEKELTSPEDILDATEVAHILNIDFSVVEISEIIKLFYHSIPEVDKTNRLATGNLKARISRYLIPMLCTGSPIFSPVVPAAIPHSDMTILLWQKNTDLILISISLMWVSI